MYPHPPANYQYYRQGPHYPSEHGAPVMPPGPNPPPQMNEPPQMAQYAPPPPVQQPPPTPMETDANGNFFFKTDFFSVLVDFFLYRHKFYFDRIASFGELSIAFTEKLYS